MANRIPGGLLSPFLAQRRVEAVKPFLRGRVLDVGCGAGPLCPYLSPENYLGVDPDPQSLALARSWRTGFRFLDALPDDQEKFDTVASLAVIEHVADPQGFLIDLARRLSPNKGSRLVLTTPAPHGEKIYSLGARIWLFSRQAHDEHEELLSRARLGDYGQAAGLRLELYRRFLFGFNQLCVFAPNSE